MLLLIDNYDSFTFNLVQYLGELGAEVVVRRNDALDARAAMALRPDAIVMSPGPGDPDSAGVCLELVTAAAEAGVPLLGVCLGHQAIGQAFGGRVTRGPAPVHGKTSEVTHDGTGVFAGLESPLVATRYHSLVVAADSVPAPLVVNARLADGTVMGLRHPARPVHGVQFHPESIASAQGRRLLATFLATVAEPA